MSSCRKGYSSPWQAPVRQHDRREGRIPHLRNLELVPRCPIYNTLDMFRGRWICSRRDATGILAKPKHAKEGDAKLYSTSRDDPKSSGSEKHR
jgi:hypothetical protein